MSTTLPDRIQRGSLFAATLLLALAFPAGQTAWAEAFGDALRVQLERQAGDFGEKEGDQALPVLARFYEGRAMTPTWVRSDGAAARAVALAQVLRSADRDGLEPVDYQAAAVARLLAATDPRRLAELEARLSLGLMRLLGDLATGRFAPSQVNRELHLDPRPFDRLAALRQAAAAPDVARFVDGHRPPRAEYRRLRTALAWYRALAEAGPWPQVAPGKSLEQGMRDRQVGALRRRLQATGDLPTFHPAGPGPGDPNRFDPALAEAVKGFQQRHGLEQDGVVGRRTRAALNVSARERVRQVALNLERHRWMPHDLGTRHIAVNQAAFTLELVEGSRAVFTTRVIVGKPRFRTPVLGRSMTYLVLNPYWNVPRNIARRELLPKVKEDPGYFAKASYAVFDGWSAGARRIDPAAVDWTQVTARNFPYRLRQDSGPKNALGRIKFIFPNPFNVYLHDTPSKRLFARARRAFSHGCVRVQHPEQLAAHLLRHQTGWSLDRIQAVIASGKRVQVPLAEPLNVHLRYLTAWMADDGSVHFRDDLYGRDKVLAAVLL